MVRILSLVLLLSLGMPLLGRADFSYLKVEITAPSNSLVTEGMMANGPSFVPLWSYMPEVDQPMPPPPILILHGGLDLNVYRCFDGETGGIPVSSAGTLLLTAAKDATYSAHVTLDVMTEGIVAAQSVGILLNSRERISYDLTTDTFYYGTKVMAFPRNEPFQINFSYGGSFTYHDAGRFEVVSQSGVLANVSILTIPEPTTVGMVGAAAALFFVRRRTALMRLRQSLTN